MLVITLTPDNKQAGSFDSTVESEILQPKRAAGTAPRPRSALDGHQAEPSQTIAYKHATTCLLKNRSSIKNHWSCKAWSHKRSEGQRGLMNAEQPPGSGDSDIHSMGYHWDKQEKPTKDCVYKQLPCHRMYWRGEKNLWQFESYSKLIQKSADSRADPRSPKATCPAPELTIQGNQEIFNLTSGRIRLQSNDTQHVPHLFPMLSNPDRNCVSSWRNRKSCPIAGYCGLMPESAD